MVSGLMLTIGSLLFIILLFLVYYSKQRFVSIRNKIYRYMLIIELLLLVSEIAATFLVGYYNNSFVNFFIYRFHWFTGVLWFGLLYYYCYVFINNVKAKNIFEVMFLNGKTKGMTIAIGVLAILYFFIPFERLSPSNISYIPGPAAYYVLLYCVFVSFRIIEIMLKHKEPIPVRKKVSIWLILIELTIISFLQLFFPTIAIVAIGTLIQMYFLYFNIENPDLEIISELEVVKDDIERSNKAKSDFLSNMSHEIRSPMNAIVGFSETLLNDPKFDEKNVRTDIKHISLAGNNLLDIINNILDISKIESGKETLEMKEYSVANIVMELTSIIEARIGDRPVKLLVDVDENIPSVLYGDSTKVFQILLNILTNAVKYTEVGKVRLSIDGDVDGDYVNLHFKVSDTGYGIKKEDYHKLFEKFSRLETAKSNEIEGTGLGLVITKKYVDLMNGKIWFESEYEVGTTFYVDLSQKIISHDKLGSITEPVKSENELNYTDCSMYNALIVDDNKLNIKVASRLLEPYKFNVDTVTNGKDCIYKVKQGKPYDIIFLDHMMPEMDGIKTLELLKKIDGYKLPPVVALTANAITGMKEMYLKAGFDEYLSKPINVSELNKIINKYFEK